MKTKIFAKKGIASESDEKKSSYVLTGFLGFLGLLFLCGSLLLMLTFRQILEYVVRKEIVLAPGKEIYETWKDPPIPIYFTIFLFNVTNKEDFPFNKNKPIVQELGPYVFREHWERENLRFYRNDSVSYRLTKTYYFEPTLSNGSLDDVAYTVNMPLLTAASMFKNSGPLVKFALAAIFRVLRESFITAHTVRQLFFEGYDDPLIKVGKDFFKTYPFDKFGFFYGRNGTGIGNFNIFTGADDSSKFSLINTFNGNEYLNIWDTKECNKVFGTDGSSFPPLNEPSRDIFAFIPDLCRSLQLHYSGTVERLSITTFRYILTKNYMDNGTVVPENKCFCSGRCLDRGVYNISICQFGAPIFLSYPHFYDADPSFLDAVIGLNPNQTNHETVFLVEPETGVPVEVLGRFQLNAYLERIPAFMNFESLPTMLFPILWFEERTSLDQPLADKLLAVTQMPYYYCRLVSYSLLVLGLVLGIAAVLYFVVVRTNSERERQNTTVNGN